MKFRLIVPIFFAITIMVNGQTSIDIDSLKDQLNTVQGAQKVEVLGELIKIYKNSPNSDSSIYYGEQIMKIGEEIQSDSLIGIGNYQKGITYYSQGKYDLSRNRLTDALMIFESLDNKKQITNCHRGIGRAYSKEADFPNAEFHLI